MAHVDEDLDLATDAEAAVAWGEVAAPADRALALAWLDGDAAPRTKVEPWLRVTCVLAAASARGAFAGPVRGDLAARARRELHRRDLRARANVLAALARIALRSAGTLGSTTLDILAPRSSRRTGLGVRIADEFGRAPIPSMLDEARAWLAAPRPPRAREVGARSAARRLVVVEGRGADEDARRSALAIEVAGALLSLARALGDGLEVRLAAREVAVAVGSCADGRAAAELRALAAGSFDSQDGLERLEIATSMALGRFDDARRALERPPFAFERDVATEALRCTAAALARLHARAGTVAREASRDRPASDPPVPGRLVIAGCDVPGASVSRRAARLLLGLERFRRHLGRIDDGAAPRRTTRRAGVRRRRRR